jgi:hypothetical protein
VRCILTGTEYSFIFLRDDQLDLAFDKAATARNAGYRHDKSNLRAMDCPLPTAAEMATLRSRLRWPSEGAITT